MMPKRSNLEENIKLWLDDLVKRRRMKDYEANNIKIDIGAYDMDYIKYLNQHAVNNTKKPPITGSGDSFCFIDGNKCSFCFLYVDCNFCDKYIERSETHQEEN